MVVKKVFLRKYVVSKMFFAFFNYRIEIFESDGYHSKEN